MAEFCHPTRDDSARGNLLYHQPTPKNRDRMDRRLRSSAAGMRTAASSVCCICHCQRQSMIPYGLITISLVSLSIVMTQQRTL